MPKTITRTDLVNAIYQEVGLARSDCADLLEAVLNKITDSLAEGDPVKISSFASFSVRHQNGRPGRNPKTGEDAPVPPHKVVIFRASQSLKDKISISPR